MKHKTPARFIDYVIQTTRIDPQRVNRANAEYLWRLTKRHGIVVPPEIDEEVFRYLRGDYARRRRYTATMFMEALSGAAALQELFGSKEDTGLAAFLNNPKIKEYLTRP